MSRLVSFCNALGLAASLPFQHQLGISNVEAIQSQAQTKTVHVTCRRKTKGRLLYRSTTLQRLGLKGLK